MTVGLVQPQTSGMFVPSSSYLDGDFAQDEPATQVDVNVETEIIPSPEQSDRFPRAIYQTGAGMSLDAILKQARNIARGGFDTIQLAPVTKVYNGPAYGMLKQNLVSAYAPTNLLELNPAVLGFQDLKDLVRGLPSRHDPRMEWPEFARYVSSIKAEGIRHVMGDMVLGHTSRAPEIVASNRRKYGEEAYKRDPSKWDGLAVGSGITGPWWDAASFDFTGPARGALLDYHTRAFALPMRAGVDVFRLDAAQELLEGEYLHELLDNVTRMAKKSGLPAPMFCAEILGNYEEVDKDMRRAIDAGAHALYASDHWWGNDGNWGDWLVNKHNMVAGARRCMLGFASNADTPRQLGQQELLMKMLLCAATGSHSYMQGAHYGRPHSVFLAEIAAQNSFDIYFEGAHGFASVAERLLRMINLLRLEPVFSKSLTMTMDVFGALTYLTKFEPDSKQMAMIAIHRGRDEHGNNHENWERMTVPFEGAGILYANNQHIGSIPDGKDMNGNYIQEFWLGPGGIVLFYYQPAA